MAPVTSKAAHKAHCYASAMADQVKLSEFANAISTQVTDVGLKELAPLKNLTDLGFYPITNQTLSVLREINLLHALGRAKGSDAKRPSKPEDVTSLDLSGTGVTNVGLKHLAPLKNLTSHDLTDTKVTDEGVEELQQLLPKCKIKR